jgi:steroid 5-alpha reductase family enzyme
MSPDALREAVVYELLTCWFDALDRHPGRRGHRGAGADPRWCAL